MSGVELPLVGSARSSSSGSSRSLNSAGSNSSSTKRLTCDEESEEEEDQDPEETSQGGLWDEVEQFLNKPSPSFGAIAKDTSTINRLPTIPKTEVSKSSNQTKGRGSISKVKKPIDPKLLEEAFAYAAHVQRQSLEDETDEQEQQHRRTNSSGNGILRQDSIRPERKEKEIKIKKKKNSSHSAYGAPLKPTQKKKSFSTGNRPSLTSTSNSTTNSSEWDSFQSSSSSLDPQTLQSLVSNFQNGTTLDELRRELAASQQSIAQSRQVIQDAAKTFFTK